MDRQVLQMLSLNPVHPVHLCERERFVIFLILSILFIHVNEKGHVLDSVFEKMSQFVQGRSLVARLAVSGLETTMNPN